MDCGGQDRREDSDRATHTSRYPLSMRAFAPLTPGLLCMSALMLAFPGVSSAASLTAPKANSGAEWTMAAGDYASTRYSALSTIDTSNVARLKVEFTFSTGVDRGQEAAPIVVGSTMYIVAPFPNTVFALDLSKPGAPLKWKYEPKPEAAAQGVACCDVVNRGGVYWQGQVHLQHARRQHRRGRRGHRQGALERPRSATSTRARPSRWRRWWSRARCWSATPAASSACAAGSPRSTPAAASLLWKAYNTGPDADVLIGADFKPFYAGDRGKDLGVTPGRRRRGRSAAARSGAGSPTTRART